MVTQTKRLDETNSKIDETNILKVKIDALLMLKNALRTRIRYVAYQRSLLMTVKSHQIQNEAYTCFFNKKFPQLILTRFVSIVQLNFFILKHGSQNLTQPLHTFLNVLRPFQFCILFSMRLVSSPNV